MKPILITVLLAHALTGCAVMSGVSTVTTVTTGKSLTDHVVSGITDLDCATIPAVSGEHDYYCERTREPGTVYNRNSY
jgi:Zn-dependent alcohol dehydrogenase